MGSNVHSLGRLVAQNEHGRFLKGADSQYFGTKFAEGGEEVLIQLKYPRPIAEQRWRQWQAEPPTEAELARVRPMSRKHRRDKARCDAHNGAIPGAAEARKSHAGLVAAQGGGEQQDEGDGQQARPTNREEQVMSEKTNKATQAQEAEQQADQPAMDREDGAMPGQCYVVMADGAKGSMPAMVLTDERDAEDMVAALQAAGAVMDEAPSYRFVQTVLRH